MSRIIRRQEHPDRAPRQRLALVALGLAVAAAAVLALGWIRGAPREQHDIAIDLATTQVGA